MISLNEEIRNDYLYISYNSLKSFLPILLPLNDNRILIENIDYTDIGISFQYSVLNSRMLPIEEYDKVAVGAYLKSIFLSFVQKPPNA